MKIVQKEDIELSDTLVPDLFILNLLPVLEGIDVKLYIYMLLVSKKGMNFDVKEIAKKFSVTEQDISFSLDRMQIEGLIEKNTEGYYIKNMKSEEICKSYTPKIETKKTKQQTETEQKRIAAATAINESFFQGLMSLGWYTDIGDMFEKYKFSEEVMIALFHYCKEKKSLSRKYVYVVAESWYNGGVKTFEQLEEYLEKAEKTQKIKQKILKALRLNRNFTKYEEQYIDKWVNEYKYDFDIIEEALKRTVSKTNPSINYINGILNNWYTKNIKTVEDIQKESKVTTNRTSKSKSNGVDKIVTKYQNYEQRNYDDLESYYDNV